MHGGKKRKESEGEKRTMATQQSEPVINKIYKTT